MDDAIGGRNLDIVQKAQLHISEVKTKITDLLELPTEKRGEDFDGDLAKCTKEVKSAEVALQAALLAQPEPEAAEKVVEKRAEVVTETSEQREEVELRAKINFGRYIGAAMAGTGVVGGAEAELNAHQGLAENMFPLDLMVSPPSLSPCRRGCLVSAVGSSPSTSSAQSGRMPT